MGITLSFVAEDEFEVMQAAWEEAAPQSQNSPRQDLCQGFLGASLSTPSSSLMDIVLEDSVSAPEAAQAALDQDHDLCRHYLSVHLQAEDSSIDGQRQSPSAANTALDAFEEAQEYDRQSPNAPGRGELDRGASPATHEPGVPLFPSARVASPLHALRLGAPAHRLLSLTFRRVTIGRRR